MHGYYDRPPENTIWETIKEAWISFWFKWEHDGPMIYGGPPSGYLVFRHNRLMYMILICVVALMIYTLTR